MQPNTKQSRRWVITLLNALALGVSVRLSVYPLYDIFFGMGSRIGANKLTILLMTVAILWVIYLVVYSQIRREGSLARLAILVPFFPYVIMVSLALLIAG